MWRELSVGQQEIHEYEAFRGGSERRLYCRLTSFRRSLQTFLRINLDSTVTSSMALKSKHNFVDTSTPLNHYGWEAFC